MADLYYLSATDVTTRMGITFVQDITGKTGADLTTYLETLISEAEATAHGYADKGYEIPLTNDGAVAILREWVFQIVQYNIWNLSRSPEIAPRVRTQYTDAISQLKDLEKGVFVLPGAESAQAATGLYVVSQSAEVDWDEDAEHTF